MSNFNSGKIRVQKAGIFVGEQERYKILLKKMIDQTENFKFQSSEELIQALVDELTKNRFFSDGALNTNVK